VTAAYRRENTATPPWPTREQWQANAERHVRQGRLATERVPNEAEHYLSADELAERDRLRVELAVATRPLLTAEITRLRALVPDKPRRSADSAQWWEDLWDTDPDRAEAVQHLHHLEVDRRYLTRYLRNGTEGPYGCPFAGIPDNLIADPGKRARLRELAALHQQRLQQAAEVAEQDAVDREITRRGTEQAWQRELQRRERIDHARHGGGHLIDHDRA
jgi:hypothetical protein